MIRAFSRFAGVVLAVQSSMCFAEDRLAMLIGNDGYQNIVKLENAVADARTIGAILTKLGFETVVETDVTQSAFNRSLSEFEKRIGAGDTVVFFYSGHGVEIANRNYLLPVDVPAANADDVHLVRRSSFAIDELIDSARNRGAKSVIAIIDACRNNPFPDVAARSAEPLAGLAKMETPEGVFILFSAGVRQRALDSLGPNDADPNSVFTRALRKHLASPGLDLVSLAQQVRQEVKELAASVSFKQSPSYFDQLDDVIILVPNGGKITIETNSSSGDDSSQAASIASETAYWNGVLLANQEASYRSYLAKVEQGGFTGIFSDLARQRLEDIGKNSTISPNKAPADSATPDEGAGKQVAALGGPSKILTAGKNGTVYVEGSFVNLGNGEWLEENTEHPGNPMYFSALEASDSRVLLYDKDRDFYLELNLKSKKTRWKRGNVRNWNSLYKITKIEK